MRILFRNDLLGTGRRLAQQIAKRNGFPGAGSHELSIFSEDAAKRNMLKLYPVSEALRETEELLKVQMLRSTNDIPDSVRVPMLHSILERRRVGRRIPKSAIRFLNNERILRKGTVPINNRSFAEFYHPKITQPMNHAGQLRVVEAFAQLEVESNFQKIVNLPKF